MHKPTLYLLLFLFIANLFMCKYQDKAEKLNWQQWPGIPDQIGYAGAFVGVANQQLLAAGGANFPDGGAPWTGSKKVWTDQVFTLGGAEQEWKLLGHLPRPLGYGMSVNWKDKMILVGGSNEEGHSDQVYQLEIINGKLKLTNLQSLPHPIANTCGALVGDTLYVLGGIEKPDSKAAATVFWSLTLSDTAKGWQSLPTWPGVARMLAVAGTDGESVFLLSGVALKDGKRQYLKDAYRYLPNKGWQRLADLPKSVAAAPSPALYHQNCLWVFGGDDGQMADKAGELKERHPGFSNLIYGYHPLTDTWQVQGKVMTQKKSDFVTQPNHSIVAPVTTGASLFKGFYVIPQGEVRPATRTNNVIALQIDQ